MVSVLLIGVREDDALRKGFHRFTNVFRYCDAPEEAKTLLAGADLFFLDGKFGVDPCRGFLLWAGKNTSAVGVIVEDAPSNDICIEAINSGIVCDYLIRPVTAERYAETWVKFKERLICEKLSLSDKETEARK